MAEVCTGKWAEPPEGMDWCVGFPNTVDFWSQGVVECCLLILVTLLIGKAWNWIRKRRRKVYVVPPTNNPYDQPALVHGKRGRR